MEPKYCRSCGSKIKSCHSDIEYDEQTGKRTRRYEWRACPNALSVMHESTHIARPWMDGSDDYVGPTTEHRS